MTVDPDPVDEDYLDSLAGDDPDAHVHSLDEAIHYWPAVDLAEVMRQILNGTRQRPVTEILWPNGADFALFYKARVNLIFGPSTSGKTWAALVAITQVLAAGGTVAFIDVEDYSDLLADRLLHLGVTAQSVAAQLTYYEQPGRHLSVSMAERIGAKHDLVVVDAVGGLMHLSGLDPDKNMDVHKIKPALFALASGGACVILLDHTSKADTGSMDSIGAGSKRQILTGASYRAHNVQPFHKDGGGRLQLVAAKDRAGAVPYRIGTIAAELRQHHPGEQWSLDLVDGLGREFTGGGR